MSTPVIAFFNNKGGVGKTSLVYHLACMYAELEIRVVAADMDPQCNLTAAFLDADRLEALWWGGDRRGTVYGLLEPLMKGTGDIAQTVFLEYVGDPPPLSSPLALLVGDLGLSSFEDDLAGVWPECLDRKERAFRVTSALWRLMQQAAEAHGAQAILMDLGPNFGAINRAALISADYVVVPLSPDLFSLQGLRNLGPTLHRWREEWTERRARNAAPDLELPEGTQKPLGYTVLQHSVRLDRPVHAYDRWLAQIPGLYREALLGEPLGSNVEVAEDPHCLALLKHYRSLMQLAQEAGKPMFQLKPADGAMGAHMQAVQGVYRDFDALARKVAERTGLSVPSPYA